MALFRFFSPAKRRPPNSSTSADSKTDTGSKCNLESGPEDLPKWESLVTGPLNPDTPLVRVILIRESEKKGKKLLFDSQSVVKHTLPKDFEYSNAEAVKKFEEVNEGFGYQYLHPVRKDVKRLGEMMYGSAPVKNRTSNMKMHFLQQPDEFMWSTIFPAPKITQGKSSDQSIGSSFGSNVGSFHADEPIFPHVDFYLERLDSEQDSGFFCGGDSKPNSYQSFRQSSVTSSDRRKSSNSDLPSWGSICSLQRRWLSSLESSLSPALGKSNGSIPTEYGSLVSGVNFTSESLPSFGPSSISIGGSRSIDLLSTSKSTRHHSQLALGFIVCAPCGKKSDLMDQNIFVENVVNKLVQSAQQAYIRKKSFVHVMHQAFEEAHRNMEAFFLSPRLDRTAWHVIAAEDHVTGRNAKRLDHFVRELCALKRLLDTKDNNFFLSTLLTGVLTHHLGWVPTVMPSEARPKENGRFQKPKLPIVEDLGKAFWYNPQQIQYRDLHGMVGFPCQGARTVLQSSDPDLLHRLIYVLTYFIRCSSLVQHQIHFSDTDLSSVSCHKVFLEESPPEPEMPPSSPSFKSSSGSSPNLNDNRSPSPMAPTAPMKRSKTALGGLSSLSGDLPRRISKGSTEVIFLVGENETLRNPDSRSQDLRGSDFRSQDLRSPDFRSEPLQSPNFRTPQDVQRPEVTSVGVPVAMEKEEGQQLGGITAVEIPFPRFSSHESGFVRLPSLICCADSIVPNAVLQGFHSAEPKTQSSLRPSLRCDLQASLSNSFVNGKADEFIGVVADCDSGEVDTVSSEQVVIGRPGTPVNMAPIVANMIDAAVGISSLGSHVVLMHLEDRLKSIYLESCVLAEYLLHTELTDLNTLTSSLGFDSNDVRLLLAAASTHTPDVTRKYGLSFA